MKPRLAFALPLVLLLTACDGVYSPNPIGDEALPLDVAEWQGTWLQGEIVMLTTVLDAENGLLQVAWLERGSDGARYEVLSGEVRRSGDMVFLNVLDEPDEAGGEGAGGVEPPGETAAAAPAAAAAPLYWWARARSEGSRVTMWWPNVEAFRAAVRGNTARHGSRRRQRGARNPDRRTPGADRRTGVGAAGLAGPRRVRARWQLNAEGHPR